MKSELVNTFQLCHVKSALSRLHPRGFWTLIINEKRDYGEILDILRVLHLILNFDSVNTLLLGRYIKVNSLLHGNCLASLSSKDFSRLTLQCNVDLVVSSNCYIFLQRYSLMSRKYRKLLLLVQKVSQSFLGSNYPKLHCETRYV